MIGPGPAGALDAQPVARRCNLPGAGLLLESGDKSIEELIDVLPSGVVDAFAVVGPGAGGVLRNRAELGETAQVGLEEGGAEVEARGELTAAGRALDDQGPEDGDADPVAEDVDGSFDGWGEVGAGGGRHGVIVVVACAAQHL